MRKEEPKFAHLHGKSFNRFLQISFNSSGCSSWRVSQIDRKSFTVIRCKKKKLSWHGWVSQSADLGWFWLFGSVNKNWFSVEIAIKHVFENRHFRLNIDFNWREIFSPSDESAGEIFRLNYYSNHSCVWLRPKDSVAMHKRVRVQPFVSYGCYFRWKYSTKSSIPIKSFVYENLLHVKLCGKHLS